jgi:hypothetical protein
VQRVAGSSEAGARAWRLMDDQTMDSRQIWNVQ